MTRHYQSILAVIGLIIAMGIVGQADFEEEQRQAEQYCEMVRLWKETKGQAGWPPYDEEIDCSRYSTVILEYPDVPSYPYRKLTLDEKWNAKFDYIIMQEERVGGVK